jgi:hypothetical protein
MIAFISGHLTISDDEFVEHYEPKLSEALGRGDSFVVGDAIGVDEWAQDYLSYYTQDNVTVYHMFDKPRRNFDEFKTIGGFKSDEERDAAMTEASDYDIAWVRPGRKGSGTEKNIKRRKKKNAAIEKNKDGWGK